MINWHFEICCIFVVFRPRTHTYNCKWYFYAV
nr:MAG TPA: hypothetical protein [Caudoviricetes sp.]